MTPRPTLLPGVEFDFGGGQRFVVPPMSVGALELLQDRLNALPGMASTDPEALRTVVDATLAALRRNYPDVQREEVTELVDLGNAGDVMECVLDVGGLRRRAQLAAREAEREAAQGNAPAPAAAPPAGAPSTPA